MDVNVINLLDFSNALTDCSAYDCGIELVATKSALAVEYPGYIPESVLAGWPLMV